MPPPDMTYDLLYKVKGQFCINVSLNNKNNEKSLLIVVIQRSEMFVPWVLVNFRRLKDVRNCP